jgi:PAS domain S-box-containing protein
MGVPMFLSKQDEPRSPAHASLRDAFYRAAPGMVIHDFEGRVIDANQSFLRIVARDPEEIGDASIFELIHPEDQPKHQTLLKQLLAKQIPSFVIEKRYVRPDKSSVWVRNSVSLISDGKTDPGHLVSICEDIDHCKQSEQALKHQEQMAVVGRLASSIVHELSNPLQSSLNLIFMAQQCSNLGDASRYLDLAEGEITRAVNIAAQGLQLQRQPSKAIEVDVAELFQSILKLFRDRFAKAYVHAEFSHVDSPKLLCFPGEIRQVAANLIGNAIDAMPEGGELKIRVRPGIDWRTNRQVVRVTIADTGHGMSTQIRKRIFDSFFTTKGSEGSGLGLWITANIISKHQGSIHVRSSTRHPTSGTAFTVIFPYSGAEGKTPGIGEDAA